MSEYTKEQLSLVSTTSLPAEVSEVIRAAAIEQLKYVPKLRQYGQVVQIGSGEEVYIFNRLDTLSGATEVSQGAEPSYEDAGATKASENVKKIMKAFKITWEADNLKKLSIRAGQTRAAVDEVFLREDYHIATSLIADAGNTASGSDWSANTADPVKDIRTAKRQNRDDGAMSNTLFLNPTNNEELDSVIASNTWYSVTEQTLKTGEPFPFMGLKRIETAYQTLGTATVFTSGPSNSFEVGESDKLQIKIFDDNDTHSTKVHVWERVAPCATIRQLSVATITGI